MKDKIELDTVFDERNIRIRFVIQFNTEYRSPYLFWDGFRTSLGRNFQAVTWHAILEDFFLLDIFRCPDDVMTILKTDWSNFKILMSGCDHKFTLSCVSFTTYQHVIAISRAMSLPHRYNIRMSTGYIIFPIIFSE